MNAIKIGKFLVASVLIALVATTAVTCSDRERSGNANSDRGQGSNTIFEKGKSYKLTLSGLPILASETTVTVLEVGPYPWLKIKGPDKESFWLNSNCIMGAQAVVEAQTAPASAPKPLGAILRK